MGNPKAQGETLLNKKNENNLCVSKGKESFTRGLQEQLDDCEVDSGGVAITRYSVCQTGVGAASTEWIPVAVRHPDGHPLF